MIGVVIQGPLITFGQGPNNSEKGFNSFQTIIENIENIGKFKFQYVVSTWDSNTEHEKKIIDQLTNLGIRIIISKIPTVDDPDHRYKHHYGIYKGIEALDKDVSFIVKIRTDQLYTNEYWKFITSLERSDNYKLCISELYDDPFFVGDFIYAGKREAFEKFITGFLEYRSKNLHPCLAMDIGIKYYNIVKFKEFPIIIPSFVYFIFMPNYTRNLWNAFISEHIIVIPANIRDSILWRGVPIGDIVSSDFFKFNTLPINKNIKFIDRLVNYIRHIKIFLFKKYPRVVKYPRIIKRFLIK